MCRFFWYLGKRVSLGMIPVIWIPSLLLLVTQHSWSWEVNWLILHVVSWWFHGWIFKANHSGVSFLRVYIVIKHACLSLSVRICPSEVHLTDSIV